MAKRKQRTEEKELPCGCLVTAVKTLKARGFPLRRRGGKMPVKEITIGIRGEVK